MAGHRFQMKLDKEEDKLLLPSSSEDEEDENECSDSDVLSEDEHNIKDPFLEENSSDSDDAPDAISFKTAFEDSKAQRQQATEVIRTQLDQRKKKRKEMHDQLMKLKQEKKQKIDDKKLPDDFLENLVDSTTSENVKTIEEQSGGDENQKKDNTFEEVVSVHGPTTFKCKVLTVEAKKPKYVPEHVAHFKDRLLYGKRIRREKSAREAMLKKEKQAVRHQVKT